MLILPVPTFMFYAGVVVLGLGLSLDLGLAYSVRKGWRIAPPIPITLHIDGHGLSLWRSPRLKLGWVCNGSFCLQMLLGRGGRKVLSRATLGQQALLGLGFESGFVYFQQNSNSGL